MKTLTKLNASVAGAALGLSLLATPALAQQAGAPAANAPVDTKDVIVVTGTVSRNPAAATASPIVSLTVDDLSKRSISNVADALQTLTANNAGTDPNSWTGFGFATGASTISLRGLNDAYTLTIFNGMRSAPYPLADDGYRNFVDINSMPISITDRIDILLDGASATYGSDAIAGVVNIIPKKQIVGFHGDLSGAISQHGDAGERRVSATYGFGDLKSQGFNVYINGEYSKNDRLMMNQRGAPFNTADQSSICGPGTNNCLANGVLNGIQADGSYPGFSTTTVPFVRPYTTGFAAQGPYQMLNPGMGCQDLTAYTLNASQALSNTPANNVVCQQDLVKQYRQYLPQIQRWGANLHATYDLSSNAQAYFMVNYYDVKTASQTTPLNLAGQTAAGGAQVTVNSIYLPVYVCSSGVGSVDAAGHLVANGCNATNGSLNPNNPFAANGQLARLSLRAPIPRSTTTDAQTFRIAGGIDGTFGKDWQYHLAGTMSSVALDVANDGYVYLAGLESAIATGSFNFVDPKSNSASAMQQIFPTERNHSISKLTEIQASLGKDLVKLPGGMANLVVTGQYRYEAIHAPSDNPPNNANPDQRYYSINAAGTDGSRTVWSAGYELTLPVTEMIKLKAEGNYDHYSAGQHAFSPKFEAEFKPISQIKLRSTFSRGFRAPSF